MQMTFFQFMASQNLRVWFNNDDETWSILRANGKVLKRKTDDKEYTGYASAMAARNDLEEDLVKLGVLTPVEGK